MTTFKTCSKCGETKYVTAFSKDAANRDGLRSSCKACRSVANAINYATHYRENKIKCAAYYAANSEKIKAKSAAWAAANPEKCKATSAAYRAANRGKYKLSSAAWAAANPEKCKISKATYAAENRGKIKATQATYRAANPEKRKATVAAWSDANPDARRIHNHNRRARKLSAGGKLSRGIKVKLFKLQCGLCPCCRQPLMCWQKDSRQAE